WTPTYHSQRSATEDPVTLFPFTPPNGFVLEKGELSQVQSGGEDHGIRKKNYVQQLRGWDMLDIKQAGSFSDRRVAVTSRHVLATPAGLYSPHLNDLASMDPADTGHQTKTADELSQALANQGALVGHHDMVLREVVETLRNLSANVQRIGTQVELLTSHPLHSRQPPPAPAAPPHQLREAVIPTPERYAGDLDNHLRERRRDRNSRHPNPSYSSPDPQIGTATAPISRSFPTPYTVSPPGEEPMQVGRARLSPSE
ncbi:hypothetical protein NQZ68_032621, partial [Dissostichus eleginoides]